MDDDCNNFVFFINYIKRTYSNITLRTFRSLYGIHIFTAAILYMYAVSANNDIEAPHILWFLHWIKTYNTVDVNASYWKCDPKTFRKYVYQALLALFGSLDSVS